MHLFTCEGRHTKFYYEDTSQNPKMYTQANKQNNMGWKYLFYQFCFSILSSLELNQRYRIVRHDIPGVINSAQAYQLKYKIMQMKKNPNKWLFKCLKCILNFHIYISYNSTPMECIIILKSNLLFNIYCCLFCLYTNSLWLSNL